VSASQRLLYSRTLIDAIDGIALRSARGIPLPRVADGAGFNGKGKREKKIIVLLTDRDAVTEPYREERSVLDSLLPKSY
jgi:hypothetical protein